MSSDEVMGYEANGGYNPREIYEQDADIRRVMDQMVDGTYSNGDTETFRELFNSLINQDVYFILKDFRSYAEHVRRSMKLQRQQGMEQNGHSQYGMLRQVLL